MDFVTSFLSRAFFEEYGAQIMAGAKGGWPGMVRRLTPQSQYIHAFAAFGGDLADDFQEITAIDGLAARGEKQQAAFGQKAQATIRQIPIRREPLVAVLLGRRQFGWVADDKVKGAFLGEWFEHIKDIAMPVSYTHLTLPTKRIV